MTALTPRRSIVLAVKPTHRCFGWIAFEAPFAPYDWGIVEKQRETQQRQLAAFEKLIARLTPEVLVLEAFEQPAAKRTTRTQRLCRAMAALAADRGVQVEIYSFDDIRASFASVGARTRDEIAAAVARHLDALRHRLPRRRRAWDSLDRRIALFTAAALAMTHYQLGASQVFEDLRGDP